MRIDRLTIEQLRLFDLLVFEPVDGINLLVGDNGAGKTTILEAIHMLSNGRSFRGGVRDALIRKGSREVQLFAELVSESEGGERTVRLGLSRSLSRWSARIDGSPVEQLSRLFQQLAVVCFEPGSHALISGSSEHRRRFTDWALFHVEPSFIETWRRYQRALKQRNALLKQQVDATSLATWEHELAQHGATLHRMREQWLEEFKAQLAEVMTKFLPELGELQLVYQSGWAGDGGIESLKEALQASRPRDLVLGYSTTGPHRADWTLGFAELPVREMFSRGQEKLVVLACLLAQAKTFAHSRGQWPVLLLDDLPSELDARHLGVTLGWLANVPAQSFLTGTAAVPLPTQTVRQAKTFHVEQGRIAPLL